MPESICIAHGNDLSEPSGGTNRVVAFAKGLHNAGFDVHVVIPKPRRELPEDLKEFNLHRVPIEVSGNAINKILRALSISLKAKKVAKKNNAVLQIEHSTLAGFATLVGCSDFVLDMHDITHVSPVYLNLPFSKIVQKFIYSMEQRAVSKASKIIVVSNPMKDFILNEWEVSGDKIKVIPNGYFESKLNNFNFEDIKEVDGMISFLGSLGPKVDLNKIINLARSFENLNIYIIGNGSARGMLEKKIREHDLKNVVLTGRLPYMEALKLVAKSKVAIAPYLASKSLDVSCPVKLFDYAALGKAIVADEVSEMCKIFKENNAALVSDPENQDEFIENVKRLLEDEKSRKKISYNAKKLIKDFTWEKQGEKLVKMYENLICGF